MASLSFNPGGAPAAAAEAPPGRERRILILAPTGNDGRLTAVVLGRAGMSTQLCRDMPEILCEIADPGGVVLLAEETLNFDSARQLLAQLGQQPQWSDLPVIIVTSGSETDQSRLRRLAVFGRGSNVSLLERPFGPETLISAIEAALRARARQYQVRDLLKNVRDTVERLNLAREAAERASRAKDDFLAALSHELRTPLNPVLLLATEAAADPKVPPDLRADFDTIAKNVLLEARLIDDLLDVTRITRGKLRLDLRPTPLHAVLRDAIANVEAEVRQKLLTLTVELYPGTSLVDGDPVRLQQVFWNVLKNAAKFTPAGGRISVRTSAGFPANRVAIEIADTGIGLAPEEAGRIFDAFAQGDHAGRRGSHRFGGLGLGLAISRTLVELHSGTIRATSEGIGRGACFTIELPLLPAAGRTEAKAALPGISPAVAPGGDSPLRILLVEDHEPTRKALAQLLGARHHAVATADSVAEAWSIGHREPFDLLITDIGLPDGSGYELMEELGKLRGLRGIALTGYGTEQDVERSQKAGFVAHLTKPVPIRTLDAALNLFRESRRP